LAKLVGKHHSDYLQKQIEQGGLLLWVNTTEPKYEKRAVEILRKHSAQDVHIHDMEI